MVPVRSHARSDEARSQRETGMALLRKSVATKDETEAAREDVRGGKDEGGVRVSEGKKKDDDPRRRRRRAAALA